MDQIAAHPRPEPESAERRTNPHGARAGRRRLEVLIGLLLAEIGTGALVLALLRPPPLAEPRQGVTSTIYRTMPLRFGVPEGWWLDDGTSLTRVSHVTALRPGAIRLRQKGEPAVELEVGAKPKLRASRDPDPIPALRLDASRAQAKVLHDRHMRIDRMPAADFAYIHQTGDSAMALRLVTLRLEDRTYTWQLRVRGRAGRVLSRFGRASTDLDRLLADTRLE